MVNTRSNYRMTRREFLDSHVSGSRTLAKDERRKLYEQAAKKYLKDSGLIGPKLPSHWQVGIGEAKKLEVVAMTRSEARAMFKKELGVKQLPTHLTITKVIYESSTS